MQDQLLVISPSETQEHSDSQTRQLIREWLFRFGVNFEKDVAPVLPLWEEAFGGMKPRVLESLFKKTLNTCKFFPRVADVLEHAEKVKESAIREAAGVAWKQVLEIYRKDYNPDLPEYLAKALARLPERVGRAARAAGVFREHESVESLHVWAKKIFIESFLRWDETGDSLNLLPEGDVKDLLIEAAGRKALPLSTPSFALLHERGLAYSARMKQLTPELSAEDRLPVADEPAGAARKVLEQPRERIVAVSDETRKAVHHRAENINRSFPLRPEAFSENPSPEKNL